MPSTEDRDDTGETRTKARQPAEAQGAAETRSPGLAEAHQPRDVAARPEGLLTRLFARRWSIVAGVCLLVGAAFLSARRMDAAFVAGTLGIVAWFWNERNRLRPHGIEAEEKFQDEDEEFEERNEE